jgi:hypothetical protein
MSKKGVVCNKTVGGLEKLSDCTINSKSALGTVAVFPKNNFLSFCLCCGSGSASFSEAGSGSGSASKWNPPLATDPDPHLSEKLKALEGHFGALEGPNLEKASARIRIRIKLKGGIRIRPREKGMIRICTASA